MGRQKLKRQDEKHVPGDKKSLGKDAITAEILQNLGR